MTPLQVQSTIKYMCELWPDWSVTGAVLQRFEEMFKYADEDKACEILKKAWGRNDYKTPPKKFILDEIEKIKKRKPFENIMVYALRDDGKSVTVSCCANNPEHAREVMRKYMFHWYDRGRDCDPNQFVPYVGEEQFRNFRRDLLAAKGIKVNYL